MSESRNVLIAVGQSQDPKIPEQTYENIFTRHNVGGLSGRPDGDFYNQVIENPSTPKWGDKKFDIYGFMSGDCYYTYPNSIQCMVDFFNKHDHIKVVVCDMLYDRELFKSHRYVHPGRCVVTSVYCHHGKRSEGFLQDFRFWKVRRFSA